MVSVLIAGLLVGTVLAYVWSVSFPREATAIALALRSIKSRLAEARSRQARAAPGRASASPRFDRAALQTGSGPTSGSAAQRSLGSRTVAALELVVLIALTAAILAGVTFGAGHVIAHVISRGRAG